MNPAYPDPDLIPVIIAIVIIAAVVCLAMLVGVFLQYNRRKYRRVGKPADSCKRNGPEAPG